MIRISLFLLASLTGVSTILLKQIGKEEYHDDAHINAQPVFYTIVMGDLVHRHQVTFWLSSLRKVGRFQGEVVIVTDRPRCIEKALEKAGLLGEEKSKSDDVDIFSATDGSEGDLHIVKRPSVNGNIMKMRLEKARAYKNIHKAGIPYRVGSIIYTDHDFVFGKDVNPFVGDMHRLEMGKQHLLALFKEHCTPTTYCGRMTSLMVMFNFPGQRTETCLNEWSEWFKKQDGKQVADVLPGRTINMGKSGKFRVTGSASETLERKEINEMEAELKALEEKSSCRNAGGLKILDREKLWLPTTDGMKVGKRAEFIHFSGALRWPVHNITQRPTNKMFDSIQEQQMNVVKGYLTQLGIVGGIDDPFAIVKSEYCPVRAGELKTQRSANADIPRASVELPEINI